jgi:hypothetical protein
MSYVKKLMIRSLSKPKLWIAGVIVITAAGCASRAERYGCSDKDWYELGRRDGVQGVPLARTDRYRQECPIDFTPENETMYANGRNAGLVEYCEAANGYDLGRMGLAYRGVCPVLSESDFLKEFRRGQAARQAELEKRKVETQISRLTEELDHTNNLDERAQLAEEIRTLRTMHAQSEDNSKINN